MNLRKLVWRELFERKSQMLTYFLAILLGITTVVAIKNVTYYSEKAVAREMDSLGPTCSFFPSRSHCRTTIRRICTTRSFRKSMSCD